MTFALRFVNGRPSSAMAQQGPIWFSQILPHAFTGDINRKIFTGGWLLMAVAAASCPVRDRIHC
jgi:hypothetical protein